MNRAVFFVLLISLLFGSACYKVKYTYFLVSDTLWMCYDTASVQGTFVDENGNVFPLLLMNRDFEHCDLDNPGSGETYDHYAYADLVLDTVQIKLELLKGVGRSESNCGFPDLHAFYVDLTVGDYTFLSINEYVLDTVNLQTSTELFTDAIELIRDTVAEPSAQCWRAYFNKDRGLLRADFRNGHYYEIQ